MFRRTVAALALLVVLPAASDGCLTVHLEHDEFGPQVVETEGWPEISFPGRMGDDLWFQFDGDPFSVDVSDPTIESVEACPDGSVDVRREQLADLSERWWSLVVDIIRRFLPWA